MRTSAFLNTSRSQGETLQIILVYGLPFGVVTISQIAALRRAYLDSAREGESATPERVTATAVSHGIPARAVAFGLPLLFAELSQVVSYRRYRCQFVSTQNSV